MADSLAKQAIAVQQQARAASATGKGPTISPGGPARPELACEPMTQPALDQMIEIAAKQSLVDATLVREVARQESSFYPCAVSPKGATGLMQLMPDTQAKLNVANPTDPQESLLAGAKLLKELLLRYNGNLTRALSAYNAGTGSADRFPGIPPIAETQQYVRSILDRLRMR